MNLLLVFMPLSFVFFFLFKKRKKDLRSLSTMCYGLIFHTPCTEGFALYSKVIFKASCLLCIKNTRTCTCTRSGAKSKEVETKVNPISGAKATSSNPQAMYYVLFCTEPVHNVVCMYGVLAMMIHPHKREPDITPYGLLRQIQTRNPARTACIDQGVCVLQSGPLGWAVVGATNSTT